MRPEVAARIGRSSGGSPSSAHTAMIAWTAIETPMIVRAEAMRLGRTAGAARSNQPVRPERGPEGSESKGRGPANGRGRGPSLRDELQRDLEVGVGRIAVLVLRLGEPPRRHARLDARIEAVVEAGDRRLAHAARLADRELQRDLAARRRIGAEQIF